LQRVLTSVTLLGLLVLTAAAFAITEHLKLIKSPIFGTQVTNLEQVPTKFFSPVCKCPNSGAQLHFTLRHHDHVTVTIVDAADHKVATIASNKSLGAHAPQHFTWFGRKADHSLAPDGVYHPWVHLAHARRTFRFTNKITLDTKPPKLVSAPSVGNSTLFGGGGRTVAIHYAFSEPAHPVVYLGTHQIILGGHIRQGSKAKVVWAGTENHSPLPAGRYTLSVGGQDLAGNETPAADRMQVKVTLRYVQLSPARVAVRGGRRFTVFVKTGARHYTWRLGGQHGAHRSTILHLRAPTTPGTYRLVVTEDGQSSTTVVRVHG
jgi:hypothetical protein